MLQNPTVGIKHAALQLLCSAQAITSFTAQHTHAYHSTGSTTSCTARSSLSLAADCALAWLQAKPGRSLEDGKWLNGRLGMELVSKHGRRPRPTDRVHPCRPELDSQFHCRISQVPFVLTPTSPRFTLTKSSPLGHKTLSPTDVQQRERDDTVNTRYAGKVTTAASIAVAALHFLHN